ncbi:MAG: glycosyl transferase [Bacteroidetes bacterium RIFOXYA12_FULL_35_11]|nr:MAG: glycosyl transferase [Bacteroidetes bacterium GWF2_35_48]OFY72490.1 MAG: glycosyl transferase [Bacteroidetes bacterium RIFOXYA12_FULL_35_11]OFY97363.1 MAG: glycosyl transferase [Bacteroidetes bacterium RIFOXYB2_FULL_35_7]OFZ00930.1 MAG: glycosyl transferase [Bacteroidetes bacterium RIFOXYC12_FULL_35_7]HBX51985.1 glycosyl transferase [Bacteroidales bacterium]
MDNLVVSIITVCFNSETYIKNAIESVLSQSYKHIEYIIIDGGSKDGTIDIIKSFGAKISKFISEPDKGIYDAMNKGLLAATGDIVGILNSDDFYINNEIIEKIVGHFNTKSIDSVHADLIYVDQFDVSKNIRYWKSSEYSSGAFKTGWHPAHPTFFVKRDIYLKYGYFDLNFKLAADFELMLRFIEKHKISTFYIEKPFIKMRMGGATNKNIKNIINQNIECYRAFKVNQLNVSFMYPLYRLVPKIFQFFKS